MSEAKRDELAAILETVARDGFPTPCDLDVALDAIEASFDEAAAYRRGAEAMREAVASEIECDCINRGSVLTAKSKADRWRACWRDPCGAEEATYIRALPIPEARDE